MNNFQTDKYLLMAALLSSPVVVMAQYTQEQANREALTGHLIQQQIDANRNTSAEAAVQQEGNRRWWAEERRIRADIARHKATPYYGTLVVSDDSAFLGWGGGGYISKDLSIKNSMRLCSSADCHVLITFANTCVGVARPENIKNYQEWIVLTDTNPKKAVEKAYYTCERKYGKDKCIYAINEYSKNYSNTYCSGYAYEAYNQK